MDTKLDNLKFDNVEDGWNNFRKAICEVADDVLEEKIKTAAMNISEKASCLIERNYLSDRSSENKSNVKKLPRI